MALLLDPTPLRASPAYRRLLIGLSVSTIGTQLTVVAVGLQVYDITRSTLSVGVLGICALVPLVVLGLYGGALVDAYDRRKVALVASLGLMVVTVALAVQGWLHLDSVLVLYGLVAVQSAGFAINNPARTAIIPRLIEPELLPAANVLQHDRRQRRADHRTPGRRGAGGCIRLPGGVHRGRRALRRRLVGALDAA